MLSSKNKEILTFKNYLFRLDKVVSDTNYFRCINQDIFKCPVRLTKKNGKIKDNNEIHNHPENPIEMETKKIINSIKNEALNNTMETPNFIVAKHVSQLSDSISMALPSPNLMKRIIHRTRSSNSFAPPNPSSLIELVIPHEYSITDKYEDFILHDDGPVPDRVIIFGTRKNLDFLASCEHWFSDGTFKSSPPLFMQIYTIHGIRNNNVLPLIYILTNRKDYETYKRIFTIISDNLISTPKKIMTDFEISSVKAFNVVFPNSQHKCCYFHFGQSFWRNIQKYPEISHKYKTDVEFNIQLRMMVCLAFVPPLNVVETFELLINSEFYSNNQLLLQPLIETFEKAYIGKTFGRGRLPALFNIELWNCYQSTLNGEAKTNNAVEGWHRCFSSLLTSYHPNMWKFISSLKKQQGLTELKIAQYNSGETPSTPRKKYPNLHARIVTIVSDFENRSRLDYLKGIAINITLNV
ncbi:uncharacterized protein LOC135922375 [Gordionus sp. m RMFG-2023]|uniref:uncharacterized protein LOC135922375 n=1 Tax=Gordionus sp. m RMFG-2023 TaxID=3053472 RepID=UPI0031FD0AFA